MKFEHDRLGHWVSGKYSILSYGNYFLAYKDGNHFENGIRYESLDKAMRACDHDNV